MPTFAELNLLDCANCRMEAGPELPTAERPASCPQCGKRVAAYLFPALLRPAAAAPVTGTTVIGSESSCFYHANKRASVACEVCGRFLCNLCDVEVEGTHRCARCIESDTKEKKKSPRAGQRYVYYDSIALGIALGGLVFYVLSIVLAPLSLYFVIRHWNSPRSVIPRSRWRFVLAAILAVGELVTFVLFMLLTMA